MDSVEMKPEHEEAVISLLIEDGRTRRRKNIAEGISYSGADGVVKTLLTTQSPLL